MNKFLVIISLFFVLSAFSMGNPRLFPGNPLSPNEIQHLNDIEETTATLNQVTQDRGHNDQQMMEEKQMQKKKEKEKIKEELKTEEKELPYDNPRINRE